MLCDAYDKWIFRRAQAGNEKIFDLEWTFYQCFLQSAIEMITFVLILLALMPSEMRNGSLQHVITSISIGFYGKFFFSLFREIVLHYLFFLFDFV